MKIIPTWLHGVLDYVAGIGLLLIPRLLDFDPMVTNVFTAIGVATLLYSAMTRYELGLIKVIPMGVHLILDFISGGVLLMLALSMDRIDETQRYIIGALGLFEIIVVVLSRTRPAERGAHGGGRHAGVH